MKKTLNELLSQPKYEQINVKIGCKDGTSFFYCDKGVIAKKEILKLQHSLHNQLEKQKAQLERRLNNLDKIYQERIKEALKSGKIKNKEEYLSKMEEEKERERETLPKQIAIREKELDIPILDREVKEVVKGISKDESPCEIIYIAGHEKGKYWTIAEYTRKVKIAKEDC